MVGRFERPLVDLVWLPIAFPLIRPQNRSLQENLQDVLQTYRIPCISTEYNREKNDGYWRWWKA